MTTAEIQAGIEDYFGKKLAWDFEDKAVIPCPSKWRHHTRNAPRDTVIYSSPACWINCFHQTCEQDNREISAAIRIHIGVETSKEAAVAANAKRRKAGELFRKAKDLANVLRALAPHIKFKPPPPLNLRPVEQRKKFFDLFEPEDILWIGEKFHSGIANGPGHFQTVDFWATRAKHYWRFVSPGLYDSTERLGRSSEGIIATPYRVLEWDHLHSDPILNKQCSLALMHLLESQLKMQIRAQIDSGNKSIHSWVVNDPLIFSDETVLALLDLGADPNCLKRPSQPVRFPGAFYDETHPQTLIYYHE